MKLFGYKILKDSEYRKLKEGYSSHEVLSNFLKDEHPDIDCSPYAITGWRMKSLARAASSTIDELIFNHFNNK